jgi:maleate isomerase
MSQLLAPSCTVHTTRFPVVDGPLPARLAAYNQVLPDMIGSFGDLALDALVVACSGSRYLLGPDRDQDSCAELSSRYRLPVITATLATHEVLRRLDASELILISPYQPWLTKRARRFWRRAGFQVRVIDIQTATGTHAPYEVSTADLVTQVTRAQVGDDAVLLFTGTGMSTLPALQLLGEGTNRILLTSNLCTAWWARRWVEIGRGRAPVPNKTDDIPGAGLPWALARLAAQGLTS